MNRCASSVCNHRQLRTVPITIMGAENLLTGRHRTPRPETKKAKGDLERKCFGPCNQFIGVFYPPKRKRENHYVYSQM
ncbi:unnamed protein product [Brassica napus]|uniref:(rape) hypothetical protein n=1 Tax=Brassica napus TaxID=3708 RepID=A0A816I7J8_BRANA|nr:unnamed protein product [Brassica napus]